MIKNKNSLIFLLATFVSVAASAEDRDHEAYIKELKKANNIPEKSDASTPESYTEKLRAKDSTENTKAKSSYTEDILKSKQGGDTRADGQPYIDSVLQKSGGASPERAGQPHIEALQSGKQLEPKYEKKAHHAAGISVGISGDLELSSKGRQANSFESIYRTQKKYNPTVDLHYEYHILKSRIYGDLGPMAKLGIVVTKGYGRFTTRNSEADVNFTFTAIPITGGLAYRATQLRYVIPYAQLGAVAVPFFESRKDEKETRRGLTYAYAYSFGLGVSLDWIGRKDAWDRYDAYGVLHTSLVLQHQGLRPLAGLVDYRSTTTMLGLNFEF